MSPSYNFLRTSSRSQYDTWLQQLVSQTHGEGEEEGEAEEKEEDWMTTTPAAPSTSSQSAESPRPLQRKAIINYIERRTQLALGLF